MDLFTQALSWCSAHFEQIFAVSAPTGLIALMIWMAVTDIQIKIKDAYGRGYDEGYDQGYDLGHDAGEIQGRHDLQEEMAVNEMLEDIDVEEGIEQFEDHLRSQVKKD